MQNLLPKDSPLLSEAILKSLSRNGITTILDFLQEDVEKLSAVSKLSLPEILSLRSNILEKHSAPLVSAYSLFVEKNCTQCLSTGIERFDTLLSGGLQIGCITEVCGLADSGKTQLCLQIALNLVRTTDNNVLYITTKADFQVVKIQKILAGLAYSHREMAQIIHKIKVVHVWTMEEMVELLSRIKNKHFLVDNMALVVIDSLPCLMFQYLGDQSKNGLSLLNVFVNHCKYLCKEFGLCVICVNIQTRWVDQDVSDPEDDNESSTAKEQYPVERRQRCLGKYWQHIPALVVQLEKSPKAHDDYNLCVTLLKSNYGPINKTCTLSLSNLGVSSEEYKLK